MPFSNKEVFVLVDDSTDYVVGVYSSFAAAEAQAMRYAETKSFSWKHIPDDDSSKYDAEQGLAIFCRELDSIIQVPGMMEKG